MRRGLLRIVLAGQILLGGLGLPAAASAGAPPASSVTIDGAVGRSVLDGWSFRSDPLALGESAGWSAGNGIGWTSVRLPMAFNDPLLPAADDRGGIGWYRTAFDSSSPAQVVTFEGIGGAAKVWLNGDLVATRSQMYGIPLEIGLRSLRRTGNVLVVEVDSHPAPNSLPSVLYRSNSGIPVAGWWNWGGLLREVNLRPAGDVDLRWAGLVSRMTCASAGCPFDVSINAEVVNTTSRARNVTVSGTLGDTPVSLGTRVVAAGEMGSFHASLEVPFDQAWSTRNPKLTQLSLTSSAPQSTGSQWSAKVGIRDLRVSRRSLLLNGTPIRLWGASLHEDSASNGGALAQSDLESIWSAVIASNSNVIRSHYPLNPWLIEQADRAGILVWDELPLWQEPPSLMARGDVRQAEQAALSLMIRRDISHPSVFTWSLGNELHSTPETAEWISRGSQSARAIDSTRPISVAAKEGDALSTAWNPLDLLGLNIYTGWYGRGGSPSSIGGMLAWYRNHRPGQALVASEFGAEASSLAPATGRGSEAFQRDYLVSAINSLARGGQSGGMVWVLRDFACRAKWTGGIAPAFAVPPFNNKGMLRRDGTPKLSWTAVTALFKGLTGAT